MQLFLIQHSDSEGYFLEQDEAHHCVRVLRHKVGDSIHAIDGEGTKYTTTIRTITKRTVLLDVEERFENWGEPEARIHLALSPLRQRDRFEWAIEKAVELGASEITTVRCKRTVKANVKMERVAKIATSALKQCKRSRLPVLSEVIDFKDAIQGSGGLKLIAWCETDAAIQSFAKAIDQSNEITILIGPEGDFTADEVEQAVAAGWKPVSLGHTRLRTETAAIHALSTLKYLKGF
ncbi:MAG: 16S rRNA (uracil(1498)-N(3))-methyltransferase [Bacteroidia bacterium]